MTVPRIPTAVLLAILLLPAVAGATLGEPAATIERDSNALKATRRPAVSQGKYSKQELVSGANSVREFVGADGTVFAVAWNGLVHPDLRVLLGSYDLEYRSALCKEPRKRGKRQLQVRSERLVVETWGHMRNLQGRAYLPGMIPEGVSLDEIR